MAEEELDSSTGGSGEIADPGRIDRPKLRRRPLGYRRADVDEALEARDSELAELRQDIAALWLAFAQHDRALRALSGGAPPPVAPPERPREEHAVPVIPPPEPGPTPLGTEAESIGEQLSELDEVLAAIEMATQTLERTYSEEIQGARGADAADGPRDAPGDDEPPSPAADEGR